MRCDRVDADALGADRLAVSADEGSAPLRVPSCGVAMPALQMRIATEEGLEVPDRQVGEVQVRAPSVTPGYINDPEASAAARTPDGWLRTGDLGYMAGGHLYACGRTKDLIILRGRNIHAHDVEATASKIPDVRTGNVVAFGSAGHRGEEQLVIVAETRKPESADVLQKEIRGSVHEALGVTPGEVVIVPPGTLPKTSSGKLKRVDAKRHYERGTLQAPKPSSLATLGIVLKSGLSHAINRVRR
jgi:fatty-acyl-CoA synthase